MTHSTRWTNIFFIKIKYIFPKKVKAEILKEFLTRENTSEISNFSKIITITRNWRCPRTG